jgi:hypothetical protein
MDYMNEVVQEGWRLSRMSNVAVRVILKGEMQPRAWKTNWIVGEKLKVL